MFGVELLIMLVMIALNGVFAGYEIALASISLARLEMLARENRAGAKSSLRMKKGMERSLAAIQLAITLCGAIAAATGGAGAEQQLVPYFEHLGVPTGLRSLLAIALVVVPLTYVSIVAGELVPKVFSFRNSEWVCLRLSPAMSWLAGAVWPIVWVLEKSAAIFIGWGERRWKDARPAAAKSEAAELQELRAVAALARTTQLIGAREENIIINAARLSTRPVREGMLRADDISMLHADYSLGEALVAAHLDLHTRFPVTEKQGDPQRIIGYVNFKDVVATMRLAGHNPGLRSVLRPIPPLDENVPLSGALEQMMREHTHIALVRNAEGRVVGMITLEDIIEEMVGEIQDEYDRMPVYIKQSGSGWIAGGGAPLTRLRELTGLDLTQDDATSGARTLDDWLTAKLGRPVHGGEEVHSGPVSIVVRSVRRQRLHEAQIYVAAPKQNGAA